MVIYIKHGVGIHNRKFRTMHLLENSYLNEAVAVFPNYGVRHHPFRPALPSATIFFRQSVSLCSTLPVERDQSCGTRDVDGKILTDIEGNKSVIAGDIVTKHVAESTQRLIKFRGRCRKRVREAGRGRLTIEACLENSVPE